MPRAFETCLCPAHLSPTGTPGCTIEALVAPETHQLEGKQVGKKDLHLLRCRILRGEHKEELHALPWGRSTPAGEYHGREECRASGCDSVYRMHTEPPVCFPAQVQQAFLFINLAFCHLGKLGMPHCTRRMGRDPQALPSADGGGLSTTPPPRYKSPDDLKSGFPSPLPMVLQPQTATEGKASLDTLLPSPLPLIPKVLNYQRGQQRTLDPLAR